MTRTLLAGALALLLASFAPTALAIPDPTDMPQCIRQGPPCGPEPVEPPCAAGYEDDCIVHFVDCVRFPCLPEVRCLVGGTPECVVRTAYCYTEPCEIPW